MAAKVPEDRTQGLEEIHANDEVKASQVESDAGDGESFSADGDGNAVSDAFARETVTIGNHDKELCPARSSQAKIAHSRALKVVVSGTNVDER